MTQRQRIFFIGLFLCFTSCATPYETTNVDRLTAISGNLKTQGGYDSYLALEYLEFARNFTTIKDNKNANYFAKKGLAAARGDYVVPENPTYWRADLAQMEEMILMQKRLENAIETPQIKFQLPIQAAHLTYLYDCWISRESQVVFRVAELAQCKSRFYKLLDEIELYIDDLKKDKQPPVVIKEPEFKRFEILFDLNIAKLNDQGSKDMLSIIKYLISLNGDYRILIVGNADRTGSELLNQNLALRRAGLIKNYLTKNGVPDNLIELRSAGEDFPDIVTVKGIQHQLNRTVGVYVLKGATSFSDYPLPLIENFIYQEEIKKARKKRGLK